MARPPFPPNLREFQRQFATEDAGGVPLAGGLQVSAMWASASLCDAEASTLALSLTAGTILHNTKVPLTVAGISALLLPRQLGLRRYETAWMLLHKLRRAMVNVAREPRYRDGRHVGRRPSGGTPRQSSAERRPSWSRPLKSAAASRGASGWR